MRLILALVLGLIFVACGDDTKAPPVDSGVKVEVSVKKEASVSVEAAVKQEASAAKEAAVVDSTPPVQ